MNIPVIDAHADLFSKCIEDGLDYVLAPDLFQASPARLLAGGVRLQWASIYVPARLSGQASTHEALRIVGAAHAALRRRRDAGALVTRGSEVRSIDWTAPVTRTDFLLSMEGASPLCGMVERLDLFVRLGMRVLGLTHNHDNECGDGCFARDPRGLTDVGKTLLREAEARGVLLDAAHLNAASFDQVMDLADGPVIYSHGGSRALVDAPRNLTDAQARDIARKGGVLGVDFFPGHVARDGGAGTLDDVVEHVEHWVALVGPDHVGFGGDFDGIPSTLAGVEDASVYPHILDALLDRGFSPAEIEKIAWRNWLRVLLSLERAEDADTVSPSRERAS
jgi:membrane dipeptidase